MGLFRRVSDIISANINDMVDGMENPETMLKQAVREMETALGSAMDAAARAIAHQKLLQKQLAEHHQTIAFWQKKAATAVDQRNDEAARSALVRKAEQQTLVAALSDQLADAAATSSRLRNQIAAMRVKVTEARRKLVTILARRQAADAKRVMAVTTCRSRAHEAAFGRFDRLARQVEQSEAEADALLELWGCESSEAEFERQFGTGIDSTIEAELQALKQRGPGATEHTD